MNLFWLFVGAYVLGSVPFAVIIGKLKGIDVLSSGSGNPGMTNVSRLLGRKWGAVCFVLDILKSLLPTIAARQLAPAPVHGFDAELIWFLVGCFAILGHCASIFLRFRGGKGVSTALGAIIGASPVAAALCLFVFLLVLVATRFVSMASIVGVSSVIVFNLVLPGESHQLLPIFALLSAFVVYRHRKNFARVKAGTEPKIRFPWENRAVVNGEPMRSGPPSKELLSDGDERLEKETPTAKDEGRRLRTNEL